MACLGVAVFEVLDLVLQREMLRLGLEETDLQLAHVGLQVSNLVQLFLEGATLFNQLGHLFSKLLVLDSEVLYLTVEKLRVLLVV